MKIVRFIILFISIVSVGTNIFSMKRKRRRKKKSNYESVKYLQRKNRGGMRHLNSERPNVNRSRLKPSLPMSCFSDYGFENFLNFQKIQEITEYCHVETYLNKLEKLLKEDEFDVKSKYTKRIFNALMCVKQTLKMLRKISHHYECAFLQYLIKEKKTSIVLFILNLQPNHLAKICSDIRARNGSGKSLLDVARRVNADPRITQQLQRFFYAYQEKPINTQDLVVNEFLEDFEDEEDMVLPHSLSRKENFQKGNCSFPDDFEDDGRLSTSSPARIEDFQDGSGNSPLGY